MKNLEELQKQYEKLGKEIEKLKNFPAKQEVYGCLAGLENRYVVHVADKEMTWKEAMDYAESIGMRLPTKIELQLLADTTTEFDLLGWAWSSSTQSVDTTNAWNVYMLNGATGYYGKNISRAVICVAK